MLEENTNSFSVYIGIDPGASGGLAVIANPNTVTACHMLSTDRAIWQWFEIWKRNSVNKFAVIEKVGGYVGSAQPGSAMFKFGRSYGFLHGCLCASEIPYEEATPQKWQKALGIAPRCANESKTQWKNRLKQFAERLFPNVKVTLAVADALLIAEYCRRMREGKLNERL